MIRMPQDVIICSLPPFKIRYKHSLLSRTVFSDLAYSLPHEVTMAEFLDPAVNPSRHGVLIQYLVAQKYRLLIQRSPNNSQWILTAFSLFGAKRVQSRPLP
jgi:hypothetical protein